MSKSAEVILDGSRLEPQTSKPLKHLQKVDIDKQQNLPFHFKCERTAQCIYLWMYVWWWQMCAM
jgi:hypothetical protein